MARPLKQGILGARTIFLSKYIDKHAFMCSSNFYESDINKVPIYFGLTHLYPQGRNL